MGQSGNEEVILLSSLRSVTQLEVIMTVVKQKKITEWRTA